MCDERRQIHFSDFVGYVNNSELTLVADKLRKEEFEEIACFHRWPIKSRATQRDCDSLNQSVLYRFQNCPRAVTDL